MRKLTLFALVLATLTTLLAAGSSPARADAERWLHVRVLDGEDKVSVNLPIELVASVLASVDSEQFRNGNIVLEDQEFDPALVTAILEAAVRSKDGEFVRIEEGDDVTVTVHKKKDTLHVDVKDDGEVVQVEIPIAVAKAMLDGGENSLNIKAALEVLGDGKGSTLVTVDDGESKVRVWVNSSMEGI